MAKPLPWLVPSVWTGALLPVPLLAWQWNEGALGANPIEVTLNRLGLLGLISLMACLACTPLQALAGWTWPARVRRHLGLLCFAYISLHLLMYVEVDQQLNVPVLLEDVAKRPFITLGFAAWLLMVPLALTSTSDAVKRMGFARWKRLHRLAYACGALGCLHFILRHKTLTTQTLTYAGVFALAMVIRAQAATKKRRKATG